MAGRWFILGKMRKGGGTWEIFGDRVTKKRAEGLMGDLERKWPMFTFKAVRESELREAQRWIK